MTAGSGLIEVLICVVVELHDLVRLAGACLKACLSCMHSEQLEQLPCVLLQGIPKYTLECLGSCVICSRVHSMPGLLRGMPTNNQLHKCRDCEEDATNCNQLQPIAQLLLLHKLHKCRDREEEEEEEEEDEEEEKEEEEKEPEPSKPTPSQVRLPFDWQSPAASWGSGSMGTLSTHARGLLAGIPYGGAGGRPSTHRPSAFALLCLEGAAATRTQCFCATQGSTLRTCSMDQCLCATQGSALRACSMDQCLCATQGSTLRTCSMDQCLCATQGSTLRTCSMDQCFCATQGSALRACSMDQCFCAAQGSALRACSMDQCFCAAQGSALRTCSMDQCFCATQGSALRTCSMDREGNGLIRVGPFRPPSAGSGPFR